MHSLWWVFAVCVVVLHAAQTLDGKPGRGSDRTGGSAVYELKRFIAPDLNSDSVASIEDRLNISGAVGSAERRDFEWESYNGWYNNLAHPDWGGAGKS